MPDNASLVRTGTVHDNFEPGIAAEPRLAVRFILGQVSEMNPRGRQFPSEVSLVVFVVPALQI